MQITVASYNIHKAVGLDRRRDPDRILAILREIDADVVALQEADRRFGRRQSVLPLAAIDEHTPYRPLPMTMRPDSIGWHGNVLLVRRGLECTDASVVPLPIIEPRGAVRADVVVGDRRIRVVGMHLDLSGLRRRHQVRCVLEHLSDCQGEAPTVLLGDMNEWSRAGGALREFDRRWQVLAPGRSFPARRPFAPLDRIIVSHEWQVLETKVHRSPLSATGSDHLPVYARLNLPKT